MPDYELLAEVVGAGAKAGVFSASPDEYADGVAAYLALAIEVGSDHEGHKTELTVFQLTPDECNTLAAALIQARDAAEAATD